MILAFRTIKFYGGYLILRLWAGDTFALQEDKNLPATSCMLRCQWKLTCGLKLPWKPYIELIGETDYTILDAVGGVSSSDTHPQIVYHLERWNISGLEALVQLVRPAGNQAIYNQ